MTDRIINIADPLARDVAKLAFEILKVDLGMAEKHVIDEAKSYERWKMLLLAIGVLAVITIGILIVRLTMGTSNVADVVAGASLIFDSAAAVYVNNQKKDAEKSANAAYRKFTEQRQKLAQQVGLDQQEGYFRPRG